MNQTQQTINIALGHGLQIRASCRVVLYFIKTSHRKRDVKPDLHPSLTTTT